MSDIDDLLLREFDEFDEDPRTTMFTNATLEQIAAEFSKAAGDATLPVIISVSPQWLRIAAMALIKLSEEQS